MTLKKLLAQAIIFWAALVLIIMYAIDFRLPDSVAISDYLMTFHTAGWIAAHGQWPALYPEAGALTFHGQAFDKLSHQLLPKMPAWSVSEYMYMPLSAFIFAPFSGLTPEFSLFCWQLVSLVAVYFSAGFVMKASGFEPSTRMRQILIASATLAFLPAALTLWIGQVGLVFGLLPLCAGFLLLKEKPLLAGIVFSLLFLKPQMLALATFLIVCELAQKRIHAFIGVILGVIVLAQANATILGPQIFQAWLNCLQLSDKIFSNAANGVAVHLATSLPRAILLSQPVSEHAALKPVVYGVALLLLAIGLGVTAMLAHNSSVIKSYEEKANLALVIGGLALPLVVPHLFLYDLCAIAPAFYLLFGTTFQNIAPVSGRYDFYKLWLQLRRIYGVYWITVTIYCVAMVTNVHFARPLLLVAMVAMMYGSAIFLVVRYLLTAKKLEIATETGIEAGR